MNHKKIHVKVPNKIKIEYSYDNSCVELSINDGSLFASLLNIKHGDCNIETENIDLIQ